jgi:hypothetical protein
MRTDFEVLKGNSYSFGRKSRRNMNQLDGFFGNCLKPDRLLAAVFRFSAPYDEK